MPERPKLANLALKRNAKSQFSYFSLLLYHWAIFGNHIFIVFFFQVFLSLLLVFLIIF